MEPQPVSVAKCLPVNSSHTNWQVHVKTDPTFDMGSFFDGCSFPMSGSHQFYKRIVKENESWSVGFNVWVDGDDIWYQAFFWIGAPPEIGYLKTKESDWHFAGPRCRLDKSNPQESCAVVTKYEWLSSTVQPMFMDFDQKIQSLTVTTAPVDLQPEVASTVAVKNTSNTAVTIEHQVNESYSSEQTTSATDTKTWKTGVKIAYKQSCNWIVDKASISIEGSFDYEDSHSTTSTTSNSKAISVMDTIAVTVDANSQKYVSVVLYVDKNAEGLMNFVMQIAGSINGQPLTGSFLTDVVKSIDGGQVLGTFKNGVTYQVNGSVKAYLAVSAEVYVSSEPLSSANVTKAVTSKMPNVRKVWPLNLPAS